MALFESWLMIFVSIPTTAIVTALLISVLKLQCATQSNVSPTPKCTDKLFKWCGIVTLGLFWSRTVTQSIVFFVLVATGRDVDDSFVPQFLISLQISAMAFFTGLWLMLVAFVLRMQYSFAMHPHLAYSPVIIKVLHFLLTVALVLVIVLTISDFLILGYVVLAFHMMFSVLLSRSLFSKIFNVMHAAIGFQIA